MILDAHSVQPPGSVLETQVCIVGAGAAGITLARELTGSKLNVILLESGGLTLDSATQNLYAGTNIGRSYLDAAACRLRYFGGTTNHWGGWCAPLDAVDFERRDSMPYSGWPFDRSYLDPWYRRAQEVCQLGPFDYDPNHWGIDVTSVPEPFTGPNFRCEILQLSPPTRFGQAYQDLLRSSPELCVCLNANAVHLVTNEPQREVSEVSVATLQGHHFSVRARLFVLAAGGIENARLLLCSGSESCGLGNEHDLVGRFFTVHLQYHGGQMHLSDASANFDYDTGTDGITYAGFGSSHRIVSWIGLSSEAIQKFGLPSFKLRQTYALTPMDEAVYAARRVLQAKDDWQGLQRDFHDIVRDMERRPKFEEAPAFRRTGLAAGVTLLRCQSEQLPNPNSRVRLSTERDALGMCKILIDWRLTAEDRARAAATLRLLGAEVTRVGLGRVRSWFLEDKLNWPSDLFGDQHHAGTTRMHRDPSQGVVNADCAVHGLANLYVAGSSVFPTIGGNNPTLTIVALALRLADHIKGRLI
jgi:choline dehydrogenase-like flavoprotein